jgi:hypothetical protein
MFPGIILSIDVYNYYEDYFIPHKRINFLMRDNYFIDTKMRMVNSTRLLGWVPRENEPSLSKPSYNHADTNISRPCGDKSCSKK